MGKIVASALQKKAAKKRGQKKNTTRQKIKHYDGRVTLGEGATLLLTWNATPSGYNLRARPFGQTIEVSATLFRRTTSLSFHAPPSTRQPAGIGRRRVSQSISPL